MKAALLGATACFLPVGSNAQTYVSGQTYYGTNNWIQYIAGDLPLIFSAPHGGSLTPSVLSNRTCTGVSDCATVTDSNTEEAAQAIQLVFRNYYGHYPHVIICRLDRIKIDCNRNLVEGTEVSAGVPDHLAEDPWNDFNNFIGAATNSVITRTGRGFYIDLHGQGHTIQRLELGYLLSATQLTNSDATLDSTTYINQSSIRTLGHNVAVPFSQLLRGSNSFGGLMYTKGYPAVPSPLMPDPGAGNPYFDGGYNTAIHGSDSGGPIDGLQIEANYNGVRDTAQNRTNYAIAIAQTLDFIFTNYYGIDLRLTAPCVWSVGAGSWTTAANWGGTLPVSGNYIVFAGPGGAVSHNLAALTTGAGRVYSISFETNTSGSYSLSGNACTLVAGITNKSAFPQSIANNLTLAADQTFCALSNALTFSGGFTNAGFDLTVSGNSNVTISGLISGAGSLTKSGEGRIILTAANTYSGGTAINGGTLLVNNINGSGAGSGPVAIGPNGILGGNGSITGPVSGNGTIAPLGILSLSGGLDLSAGGTYSWELNANSTNNAGTDFDQILVTAGNLVLNGNSKLSIQFSGSATAPSVTNLFWQRARTWRIVALAGGTNSGGSTFASVINGNSSAGWFTNYAAPGSIVLAFTPVQPPAPVIQSFSLVGPSQVALTFTTATNRSYVLQSCTNLGQSGWISLSTNVAPGNSLALTNSTGGDPARFYRLMILP